MNIGQIKFLSWLAAGLLTAGLAFYVYTFVNEYTVMKNGVDPRTIDQVITQVEPLPTKSDEIVSYEDIRRLILPNCEKCKTNPNCKHFNWTGKPPAVEVDEGPNMAPPEPKYTPIKELVRVLMIKVDLADPKGSSVYLKYKPTAAVTTKSPTGGFQLKVGEHLHPPHDGITISAITSDGVEFTFADSKREKEVLGALEFDAKTVIVQVDPDHVMRPVLGGKIPKGATETWNPERTTALGNGQYRIGTEDANEFQRNWDSILAHDVTLERHKDPRTGKYDGVELKTVAPGSMVERHGGQSGDVIKSINGQAVSSAQEGIQFVKDHQNQYSVWEVVVENRGRSRTMYFHSPQN